ncbi:MAG: ATP-dependent sacrificial sulfur transferase LarE, partial [Planctomycetota bacterium]
GFEQTLCGTNFNDKDDYRPGNIAVNALGIKTPLMDAELTKRDIRALSRELSLPTADLPASPCLASRLAYGETITEEKLNQVERAEDILRSLGFVDFRVRHHGNIARIEVPSGDIEKITSEGIRGKITKSIKALGFQYISLDLEGFRTGSLNEILSEEDKIKAGN